MKTFNTNTTELIHASLRFATWVFLMSALCFLLGVGAKAQIYTPVFSNVWVVTAGTYLDLPQNTANSSRGVGINPVTTNVLYVSTANNTNGGAGHVSVVSFTSGSNYLAQLPGTNITTGATINLQGVRVADDGAVYACNRADGGTTTFKIYRWATDSDLSSGPSNVFAASPNFIQRMGDHMDVRGGGVNTEIVVVGSSGSGANINTNFTIFRPTDASCTLFTNFSITIPGSSPTISVCQHGVTFEGTNNVVWVRSGSGVGNETRRIVYDPTTLTASCARTNAVDQTACRSIKYYAATNGVELLAGVQYNTTLGSAQIARVFRIPTSPTAALISVMSSNFPAPYTGSQNVSGLCQVDAKKGYFVFGAPGYGLTFYKVDYLTTAPPTVSAASSGTPVVAGTPLTLTAAASGSTPLSYQWYYNTNTLISGATTNVYSIASVQTSNTGVYTLITTNLYGKATNSLSISVLPNGSSLLTTPFWSLAPGSRTYLTTTDTQRGLAYDATTARLVLVSRAPTNGIHLISAADGSDAGVLDMTGFPPTPQGAFAINTCGVSDDGIVYVGNLCNTANDPFLIYTWSGATDTATIGQAYPYNTDGKLFPTYGRIGDTMAVRGSGVNTEILCSFRSGTNVALFNTTDGVNFDFNLIAVTNLPADAQANGFAGIGLAFGPGKTFWAKSPSFNLRQVAYKNIAGNVGEGEVINTYSMPGSEAPIGVDNANGYLAAVGITETPQNLAIYDLLAPGGPSLSSLSDREFYPVSNLNGNGTGAVAVDVNGGRMFALDSNNGIIALGYAGRPFLTAAGAAGQIVTWATTNAVLQATTNLTLPFADVSGATSPYTNTTDSVKFFRLKK